jgi:hypothetical protein
MRCAKLISNNEATIVTEDGGVATVHHNGQNLVTTYYQLRVEQFDDDMWDILQEGKQYLKNWTSKQEVDEDTIHAALEWLCPTERNWVEEDYYLFTTEFNHQQNKRRANL